MVGLSEGDEILMFLGGVDLGTLFLFVCVCVYLTPSPRLKAKAVGVVEVEVRVLSLQTKPPVHPSFRKL